MFKISCLCLTLLLLSSYLGSEPYTVKLISDGQTKSTIYDRKISVDGKLTTLTISKEKEMNTQITYDQDYEVVYYLQDKGNEKTEIINNKKRIKVNFTKDGKTTSKEVERKAAFYGVDFMTAPLAFIKLGIKTQNVLILPVQKPEEARIGEFTMLEKETINGKLLQKFKLGLTGFEALFWSANIWSFPDGRLARFEGNRGPGTPNSIIEIIYN